MMFGKCQMVVDWKCDHYGEPTTEIECGRKAIVRDLDSEYCGEHALDLARDGEILSPDVEMMVLVMLS